MFVCFLCDRMSFLGFGCLTRSQSKRASSDMDTDTPTSSSRASLTRPSVDGTINELMAKRDVWLHGQTEKDKFWNIKDRAYKLTPAYHPQLLRDTGGVHLPNLRTRRPCTTTGQIQHQKAQDTLHTPINRAHQDNIIHGHPHHHITHQDLLKQILMRDTEGPDHATLSPDDL
jgi:hypothetical protein